MRTVHLIGIGGTGMSAIAILLLEKATSDRQRQKPLVVL